jgi:hypothetical protein
MTTDSWDDMRKAKEDQYFEKANKDAVARLGVKRQLKSPITGEAMISETIQGVVVDRCPTSGGIWLDKGELEHIIAHSGGQSDKSEGFIANFFGSLLKPK